MCSKQLVVEYDSDRAGDCELIGQLMAWCATQGIAFEDRRETGFIITITTPRDMYKALRAVQERDLVYDIATE